MPTTRPTLPMIPPMTPLKAGGIFGRDIDRKAINELQRIQGEIGTGQRLAITVEGGDTYPLPEDTPNKYKVKWVQLQNEQGEYNEVGDSNVFQDEMSGKDFDAYVFNMASLDPLPLEKYIEKGTILEVHDHNSFLTTDYRTDQMRVKAKDDIEGYEGDGCPKIGEAIVLHLVDDCEEEWKDDQNPDDDYKVGEIRVLNVGGAIAKDEVFIVGQINGEWYRITGGDGIRWGITVSGGEVYPDANQKPNMYKFKFIDFSHPIGQQNIVGETEVEYEELTTEDYDGYVFNVATNDSLPIEAYIPEKTVIAIYPGDEFYLTDYRTSLMRAKALSDIEKYKDDGCPVTSEAQVVYLVNSCEKPWKDDQNPDDDYKIGQVRYYNVGDAVKKDDHITLAQLNGQWYRINNRNIVPEILLFMIDEEVVSTSSGSSSSSETSQQPIDPEACLPQWPQNNTIEARAISPGCGMTMPEEVDEDGMINLSDPLRLLADRRREDMNGRHGIAVKVAGGDEPSSSPSSASSSSSVGCYWVIVYIDFHRWVTVITDFLVEDNQIRIKRKNIKVWDDCKLLPDEIIFGADCPTPSGSSSAVSGSV